MSFIKRLAQEFEHMKLKAKANSYFAPNSLKLKDFHKFDSAVTGILFYSARIIIS